MEIDRNKQIMSTSDLHDDSSAEFVHLAEQTLQQRRFTASNWTNHRHQLSGLYLQIDATRSQ